MGTAERLNLAHSKQTHPHTASLTVIAIFMQIKNCNNIHSLWFYYILVTVNIC